MKRNVKKGDWYIDPETKKPHQAEEDGVVEILDGTEVRRLKPVDQSQEDTETINPAELSDAETSAENTEAPVHEQGTNAATILERLVNKGILKTVEPDGTESDGMIRGCSVNSMDLFYGFDGKVYIVTKKGAAYKYDIKSGTKIYRFEAEPLNDISSLGFLIIPDAKKIKNGASVELNSSLKYLSNSDLKNLSENLLINLGFIHNDIND